MIIVPLVVPLVCSMPIGLDGLDSSPASRVHDGLVYGKLAIRKLKQVIQLLSFPLVVRYLCPMDIFFTSVVVYLFIYLMFPIREARRTPFAFQVA